MLVFPLAISLRTAKRKRRASARLPRRQLKIESLESRRLLSSTTNVAVDAAPAVNQAPGFTAGPSQVVNSNAGTVTVSGWATNISAGPPDESGQQLNFETALAPTWEGTDGNAQHTAISNVAGASLDSILWQTPVDLDPQYSGSELLIHYGSPVITQADTVIVPVKTGATDGFELNAFNGATGSPLWTMPTDYWVPSGGGWTPSYAPVMTPEGRLYYAGQGGTIYYVNNPDSPAASASGPIVFYGAANYQANESAYNQSVYVCTPLTSDAAGNIYFGFVVTGSNPLGLQSGIARIGSDGSTTYISAEAAAGGDASILKPVYNSAPAVSNDGTSIYAAVSNGTGFGNGYLVKLDAATLAYQARVFLTDPNSGEAAYLPDEGTASPTVGPDGDVYFGVLEDPFPSNNDRGWMLHFSGDLSQEKTPGAFGWDDTASIVPASAVPSYHGTSSYLLLTKYNNYAGIGSGDGDNRVAILDPDTSMTDPISGATVMNVVLSIEGVTADPDQTAQFPGAVREWCINSAVVDPATDSAFVGSEDGKLYRWDLATNTFSQVMTLTSGLGEAYTPTLIGPNGTVYAINNATLFAVGSASESSSTQLLAAPPTIDPTTGNLSFTVLAGVTGTITVSVLLHDNGGTAGGGVDTSAPQFFTITVVAPPVVNINGGSATFIRGGSAAVVAPGLTVTDSSDVQLLSATVQIGNLLDGADETLAATTTGTNISATYDSGSGVLSLAGPDSLADYIQVLDSVTYLDRSLSANTTTRTLSIALADNYGLSTPAAQDVVFDVAPTIVGVYASGAAWTANYLSALDAAGLGDSTVSGLGYRLADGAAQLSTTLPWSNVATIAVAFSENVTVGPASLVLYDSSNNPIASSEFGYDETTFVAQWTFSLGLVANKYLLNLASNEVSDAAGAALDGEWATSVSTFASGSGNGAPGGDFNFQFNVLPGDANSSGSVTNGDVLLTKLQVGAVSNASNYRLDVNASGNISNGDVLLEKLQVGSNINTFPNPQTPSASNAELAAAVPALAVASLSSNAIATPVPAILPVSTTSIEVSPSAASGLPPAEEASLVLPDMAITEALIAPSAKSSPDAGPSAIAGFALRDDGAAAEIVPNTAAALSLLSLPRASAAASSAPLGPTNLAWLAGWTNDGLSEVVELPSSASALDAVLRGWSNHATVPHDFRRSFAAVWLAAGT